MSIAAIPFVSRVNWRLFFCLLVAAMLISACGDQSETDVGSDEVVASQIPDDSSADSALTTDGAGAGGDEFENNYAISRNYYTVDPGFVNEGLLRPGDGLDMSASESPMRVVGKQPLDLSMPMRSGTDVQDYTLSESFRLVEATSAKSEAKILTAYFQGNYKFVSAEAAAEQARQERTNSRSIYAVLESTGQVEDISAYLGGKELQWRVAAKPIFEGTDRNNATFRRQFLADYGSHYVSSVTYGYRVAIRGKITQTDTSSDRKIKAAFKAAFLTGSAEGGISAEVKKTLSSSSVELTFAATSGGLHQDNERRPGILTRLEDIIQMLEDMKQGKVKIYGAPLEATARTYWNLLPIEFTRSRTLLEDRGAQPLPEPFYGVPRGTIIPWNPPASAIREGHSGEEQLYAPPGWALCNGEEGTPDMRDRFISGTIDPVQVGKIAGAANHVHKASSASTGSKGTAHGGAGSKYQQPKPEHKHTISVTSGANLPPYVKLVYIMKL